MEFISFLEDSALNELDKANKKLLEMVSNIDAVSKKMQSMTTPSGTDSALKDLTNQYKLQEKAMQSFQLKLQKAAEQNTKNLEKQRLAEIKLAQDREKAFDKYEKQYQREQAKIVTSSNAYNKLQAELNKLTFAYQNLAVKQAQGATLTKSEVQQMDYLRNRIQMHDKTLKAVDANMGKYQRNVGNYASAFNPLSNSISQLGREMPAFANSVQTGFMAISNNLPIFFDAMQQVIAQNKELQAQGKPTKSALTQLAGALFSFQTLLSLGVTLLTLYGKELIEWVSGLTAAEKALKDLKTAQIEVQSQSVAQAKDLDKYRDVVNNTNLSERERLRALKLLKEQIPELEKVELGHADALSKVNQYTDHYIKQAAIRYRSDQFIKKAGEELIKQEEIRLKIQKNQVDVGFGDYVKAIVTSGGVLSYTTMANTNALKRLNEQFDQSKISQKEYERLAEIEIRQLEVQNKSRDTKVKHLKSEKDLVFELVDIYSSMFEINKAFLEREIRMYDELANSEHETLEDRLRNFENYTKKKLELEVLQYNENVRLQKLAYNEEVENLKTTYLEYIKQENVTNSQRVKARSELNKALNALDQKNKLDLELLELKHSDNITDINRETFETLRELREKYNGLEFNKKIKDQELKDLLEHKKRLANIDLKTTKKQLEDIDKVNTEANTKLQAKVLQNDIDTINRRLENEKLGAEEELRLKTQLYEKLKALNQLELADLEKKKKEQEDYIKLLESTFNSFINEFGSASGFGKMLDIIGGGLEKFKGNAVATALAVSDAFQEAFNTMSQYGQINFEQAISRLEMQKDIDIQFAGESATAKEEIEKQYEERRRKLERQRAEQEKKMAIFNVVTDTAQAIMATFARVGFPAGVPLAIAMGAIGAAQVAMINSQEIPAFAEGGTHDGGLMLVNDGKGSNYKETIVTPDGKIHKPQGKNVLMNAPKGTQIFTHDQWLNQMNGILTNNGIGNVSNDSQVIAPIVNVATKDNYHFEVNEQGFKTFIKRGNAKSEVLNARVRMQKRNV